MRRKPFAVEDARWRLVAVCGLMLCLFVGVWGRLLYLQTAKAEELREWAERFGGLRRRKWTVYATRGVIRDRNGNVLAMDVMALSIYIRPLAVKDVETVAKQLSPIVDMPASQIAQRIREWKARAAARRSPSAFSLKRHLMGQRADMLREAIKRERQRVQQVLRDRTVSTSLPVSWLDGVDVVEEPRRYYPYGAIASALLGFTGVDGTGLSGIEHLLEQRLAAQHGEVEGVMGAQGQIIMGTRHLVKPSRNGRDVTLTIDVNIQNIAEQSLQEMAKRHQPAAATAVVMDVQTGDLLAVANLPAIDLNQWERVVSQRGLAVMRNHALSLLYEPGSTFKPITIAAAMQAGVVDERSVFRCSGALKLGKYTIRCPWHGGSRAHGRQTLKEVVAHSCNVATAQIGMHLGAPTLYQAVEAFGLLEAPVIGSTKGRLDEPGNWATIRLANVAFGQGVMVTPVGLAAAYAALANGGTYVKPRLLLDEPVERRVVLSPEVANRVREYLQAVVEEGTGKLAMLHGYRVAGKTGTAQKVIPGKRGYARGKYIASFVGFAPAESPRIVVLVVVDEPRNGYYGGVVAAPVFARITEQTLAYLGVPSQAQSAFGR